MVFLLLGILYALAPTVWGGFLPNVERASIGNDFASVGAATTYSMNVTNCPG